MTTTKTSSMTNSLKQAYKADYVEGAMAMRVYDQFCYPVDKDMSEIKRSTAVNLPFLSSLMPATDTVSEDTDVIPVAFRDATVQITPTSRIQAILVSEKLLNTNYTNFNGSYYKKLGESMMTSIDLLPMASVLSGTFKRAPAARASLDAGTTTHRLSRSAFSQASVTMAAMKIPSHVTPRGQRHIALLHPFLLEDLLINDSVMLAVAQYQKPEMILNFEVGELNGFSIVSTPYAKTLWGAGAANASAINTTISAQAKALDKSITVASATNIDVGDRMMIGPAVETASTFYPTNESVIVTSVVSTTIGFVGEGENGGLRYDHETGELVKNTDNVFPVIFGGPESVAKVYDTEVGEYGEIVGPKKSGLADQFVSLAWKWYGGFGLVAENRILRGEYSCSIDA